MLQTEPLLHALRTEIVLGVFFRPIPERDDAPFSPGMAAKRALLSGLPVVNVPPVRVSTIRDKQLQIHGIIIDGCGQVCISPLMAILGNIGIAHGTFWILICSQICTDFEGFLWFLGIAHGSARIRTD